MEKTFSRRRFLVASVTIPTAFAIAACSAPSPNSPPKREQELIRPRFFENIDQFNAGEIGKIRQELLAFGTAFQPEFAPMNFDLKKWEESVLVATDVFSRICQSYGQAKETGAYTQPDRERYQNDFYELGSALWAILRTGDIYGKNRGALAGQIKEIVQKKFVDRDDSYGDALIGEEIYSIDARWTDKSRFKAEIEDKEFSHIASPVAELIRSDRVPSGYHPEKPVEVKTGLMQLVDDYFLNFPIKTGLDSLENYVADPQLQNRPAEARIQAESDPQTKEKILETLREKGMERCVPIVRSLSNGRSGLNGEYNMDTRIMDLTASTFNLRNLLAYPHFFRYLVYHEGAHAVVELVRRLPDSGETGKRKQAVLLAFDHELAKIRPYPELEKRYRLRQYKSQYQPFDPSVSSEALQDEQASYINRTTLTEYAGSSYDNPYFFSGVQGSLSSHQFPERMAQDFMSKLAQLTGNKRIDHKYGLLGMFEYPANALVYRHLSLTVSEGDVQINSFGDFLNSIFDRNLVASQKLDGVEKLVFTTLLELEQFIEENRTPSKDPRARMDQNASFNNWANYLMEDILPDIIKYLAVTKREELKEAIKTSLKDAGAANIGKALHEMELIRKHTTFAMAARDNELIADVISGALRRNDYGISRSYNHTEESTDPRDVSGPDVKEEDLEMIERIYYEALDLLIDEGFAVNQGEMSHQA